MLSPQVEPPSSQRGAMAVDSSDVFAWLDLGGTALHGGNSDSRESDGIDSGVGTCCGADDSGAGSGGGWSRTRRTWVLDPIDGTKGFVRGEQFAVALALLDKGKTALGVLGCPVLPPALGIASLERGVPVPRAVPLPTCRPARTREGTATATTVGAEAGVAVDTAGVAEEVGTAELTGTLFWAERGCGAFAADLIATTALSPPPSSPSASASAKLPPRLPTVTLGEMRRLCVADPLSLMPADAAAGPSGRGTAAAGAGAACAAHTADSSAALAAAESASASAAPQFPGLQFPGLVRSEAAERTHSSFGTAASAAAALGAHRKPVRMDGQGEPSVSE